MGEIEDIESWIGAEVVDSDGEKIGKLEELFVDARTNTADLALVKGGLLGRRHLVPLAGASFSRGHVRVAYTEDLVSAAPKVGTDSITYGDAALLAQHFALDESGGTGAADDVRFDTASTMRARREQAEAELRRADGLEARAARKDEEASALLDAAHQRESGATGAMSERDRLREEAEDARRRAGRGGA